MGKLLCTALFAFAPLRVDEEIVFTPIAGGEPTSLAALPHVRMIACIEDDDCMSCYEQLISAVNRLVHSPLWKGRVIGMIVAANGDEKEFARTLARRYNIRFELYAMEKKSLMALAGGVMPRTPLLWYRTSATDKPVLWSVTPGSIEIVNDLLDSLGRSN